MQLPSYQILEFLGACQSRYGFQFFFFFCLYQTGVASTPGAGAATPHFGSITLDCMFVKTVIEI